MRVNGDEGTPVPIPNTVVKLVYGDNTWLATAREDNSTRTQSKAATSVAAFCFAQIRSDSFVQYPCGILVPPCCSKILPPALSLKQRKTLIHVESVLFCGGLTEIPLDFLQAQL